jgi:hypothetical protein
MPRHESVVMRGTEVLFRGDDDGEWKKEGE